MGRTDTERRRRLSLTATHPQVAARWVTERNLPKTADAVTARSRADAWWRCGDGHDFEAQVYLVVFSAAASVYGVSDCCPTGREARDAEDELRRHQLLTDNAEIAAAWSDEDPIEGLTFGTAGTPRLRCQSGHRTRMSPSRYLVMGCPHCRAHRTRAQTPPVSEAAPELAEQWHPTRNRLTAAEVGITATRRVWWLSACCGHEWQASPRERNKLAGLRCPACRTVLGSLGYRDPDLVEQWHPNNELTAFHVMPHTERVARWRCTQQPGHEWTASVATRSAGTGCPECSTAGTSAPEKELAAALTDLGLTVRPAASVPRVTDGGRPWRVDMVILTDAGPVAVEYDGEYWHAGKHEHDAAKTADLLMSGHRVVRVRENDLPDLALRDAQLLQLRFRPRFDLIEESAHLIRAWMTGR